MHLVASSGELTDCNTLSHSSLPSMEEIGGFSIPGYGRNVLMKHSRLHRRGPMASVDIKGHFKAKKHDNSYFQVLGPCTLDL